MTCPDLYRGHCSCGERCCVGNYGCCICPDCQCQTYSKNNGCVRATDGPCTCKPTLKSA